jgi:hypothetical protein
MSVTAIDTDTDTNTKFSDLYIKYFTVKQPLYSIDPKTGETICKYSEYEKYTVIKEFIPNDKQMYYVWGNIAYSIMFDCACKTNSKIKKLTDLCIMIESKIRKGDIGIVFYDFINEVFPLINTLTIEEIKIIKKNHIKSCGPLYEKLITLTPPRIFIDLFDYYML